MMNILVILQIIVFVTGIIFVDVFLVKRKLL